MGSIENTKCRICQDWLSENSLVDFVDLGLSPLADKFLKTPNDIEEKYPLKVKVCKRCFLVQMVSIVDKDLLFNNDYGFYTGASPSSIQYFKDYANEMLRDYSDLAKNTLEIASNDGTLLEHFKNAGCNVLGVEPAGNTVDEADKKGIETIRDHFSLDLALKLNKQFSLIIANNVVAHVDNLVDFMSGVTHLLTEDGIFVFEVQYFPHLLFNNAFDHIYHEHRSFFSLQPLEILCNQVGLKIFKVKKADTQGGSIRVYATKNSSIAIDASYSTILEEEKILELNKLSTYLSFQPYLYYIRLKLNTLLKNLKAQNKTIYGYGASAKGSTLLNFCNIGTNILDGIADKTPYKFGKYSPGMHIPIVNQETITKQPDYYLVLVWNYLPGILEREKEFRANGGKFIVPIPSPIII